jgi:hypothetical protein
VVDALGNPLKLLLSEGQESDIGNAPPLLCTLSVNGSVINGDKGYDSKDFVEWLKSLGAIPNIPSRESNKEQRECDLPFASSLLGGYTKSDTLLRTFGRKLSNSGA